MNMNKANPTLAGLTATEWCHAIKISVIEAVLMLKDPKGLDHAYAAAVTGRNIASIQKNDKAVQQYEDLITQIVTRN